MASHSGGARKWFIATLNLALNSLIKQSLKLLMTALLESVNVVSSDQKFEKVSLR